MERDDEAGETESGAGRRSRSVLGLALDFLISGEGRQKNEMADLAGVAPSTFWGYLWRETLTRERLEEIAAAAGIGPEKVERAILAAHIYQPETAGPGSPVDPTSRQLAGLARASALVAREAMAITWAAVLRDIRQENRRAQLEQARKLAQRLDELSPEDQRAVVEASPTCQSWALAYVLAEGSEKMAPDRPDGALGTAELALFVAHRVPDDALKPCVLGWCKAFVGNATRALGRDLPAAGRFFKEAWSHWRLGQDPAGLFSEAHMLAMEASLRRDQRDFERALALHDAALEQALPEQAAGFLLGKAGTLQDQGEHEQALLVLESAALAAQSGGRPRELFGIAFNRAANLILLDRPREASALVKEVMALARQQGNAVDLVRARWLEAGWAAGLNEPGRALTLLQEVRNRFARLKLPYDYGAASLDQALVHRGLQDFSSIRALAAETVEIFRAQRVHREALAAMQLFQEAAERQQVTERLVKELKAYLGRAKHNPRLRFSRDGKLVG